MTATTDTPIESDAWLCPDCGPVTNVSTAGKPTCQQCGELLVTGKQAV